MSKPKKPKVLTEEQVREIQRVARVRKKKGELADILAPQIQSQIERILSAPITSSILRPDSTLGGMQRMKMVRELQSELRYAHSASHVAGVADSPMSPGAPGEGFIAGRQAYRTPTRAETRDPEWRAGQQWRKPPLPDRPNRGSLITPIGQGFKPGSPEYRQDIVAAYGFPFSPALFAATRTPRAEVFGKKRERETAREARQRWGIRTAAGEPVRQRRRRILRPRELAAKLQQQLGAQTSLGI